MSFRLSTITLGLFSAQIFIISCDPLYAEVLQEFNPADNDNRVGAIGVSDGTAHVLTGNQRFAPGANGAQSTPLSSLAEAGRIVGGSELIGAERLDPGPRNFGITIPDATTGGNTTFQVYNPDRLVALPPVSSATSVPDIANVGDAQYINARVASVNNGSLDVDIGQQGASPTASTNGWSMAAKQTTLFDANGSTNSATIGWLSQNRITFSAAAANPAVPGTYLVTDVATYNGTFSISTLDGKSANFNVTDAGSLKRYNDWLISQLKAGNLSTSNYLPAFNQAFSTANQNISYIISADDPADDVAQPVGERVVINASGASARVNIASSARLEVVGANGGAIRATNGASVDNQGKVASVGGLGQDSAAINLDASSGTNNGVINGNFLNRIDGTGVATTGYNANGVNVASGSTFDNNGIINFASTGNPAGGYTAGINLTGASSANNSGNINVGVNGSSASGTTSGVAVDNNSRFTNESSGLIVIGRGAQNSLTESVADTAVNQSETTSGISLTGNGTAVNNGHIVIGSRVQNAAGLLATGGANATLVNNGIIDVNGAAVSVPRENVGLDVVNAGANGGIINAGTINLNGVNATGMKVLATDGQQASAASTGTLNVAGGADPASGTRNFGVWVEGQDSAAATASVDGPINLSGIGAIGVHARGNATVNVNSAAVPSFSEGSSQIAFFAYGPSAKINVIGNSDFEVTTTDSTLFRLEQGADFDGSGLSLTASGERSVGVLGTGTGGTEVNTRDANLRVSGSGATGLIVEGGAKGTLDAATQISLTGVGSVGAIADGQKHTLAGKSSGTARADTSLTSSAALTSSQNGLTGLIARNRAQLNNSGNITFTGTGATGMLIESGAAGINSGTIAINDGGTGIQINGTTSQATTASNAGTINIEGGSLTSRTRGVSASGQSATATLTGALNMNGPGAIGAEALNGARVNVASTATPSFNNSDQIAWHAVGAGSVINSADSASNVPTDRSTLYRIDDAASLNFTSPASIILSGGDTTGVIASGPGSLFAGGSSQFIANGSGATALRVEGGAGGTLDNGSAITLNGNNSVGVLVNNLRTDLSNALNGSAADTRVSSGASLTGSGQNAVGYDVANGAALVNQGSVALSGANSIGIRSRSGSTISNYGRVNVAQGTGLDISGNGTSTARGGAINVNDGVAGVRISDGAQLSLAGSDTRITTSGTAHGILLDSGAVGLNASDATVSVNGSGSGIENRAEIANVRLNNVTLNSADGSGIRTAVPFDPASTVTTNVNGSGVGLNFTQASGEAASDDLILGSGYQFNVGEAGGTGIVANTTGNVRTAANVNITSSSGGSALVAARPGYVLNTGTFVSASTLSPVVDLRGGTTLFENLGTITATSPLGQAVAGSNADDVILLEAGDVIGDVNTGGGSDNLSWTGGTLNGSITLGNGVNNRALINHVALDRTRHITDEGGTEGMLTLQSISSRGGSFSADDLSRGVNLGSGWSTINFFDTQWELTDNLRLAHSTVNIGPGSTLYAGNDVHPVIAGGSDNSVTVNNAGTIDLTNGSGTPGNDLTIEGNLASMEGSVRLNTLVNEGGALSNQFTDHLQVEGNATGTTLLEVIPTTLSNANLTDLNHSGSIEGYEGISLAQVAGNASPNSFALKGGYLALGPWSYQLYSFAPGSSDAFQRRVAGGSDNQFWDYRLANGYICKNGESCIPPTEVSPVSPDLCVVNGVNRCAPGRPAVVPQVPAYISVPVGLAYYTTAILDDLHKRLGELRQQSAQPDGSGGEMFLRYTGSNMTYKTSQSFRDFGYDVDIDYSAMQIGGNLLRFDGVSDSLRGGVAYTRGNTRLRPHAADGYSSTTFDSDSVALYGTWQRDNGFYLDGALSYDWHRGETDIARQKAVAKLKGKGWTASLESGWPVEFANGVRLEPQAQLMVLHLAMDSLTDKDNLTVSYPDYHLTTGRLGARLDRTWTDDSQRQYTPYLRTNYLKGWGGDGKTTVGARGYEDISHTFSGGKYGQMWELGLGGTTRFKNDVSMYAEADYRKAIDGNGGKGWRYSMGVRWTF
ncbi:autotransporter outer membrane beta-barrel domain-containing protein [Erwinia sp. HDF1-3R]|uniref:autotransporter outer membrane beta-barrel domain-containing protein n=1 Tax=Erwinia sp. HDF1-3R TaxID=3141543 RepID=UPI0031F5904E